MNGSDATRNRRTDMDYGACSYRRFLDGDEKAFDDIINGYFRSLVFFIDGYVHDVHTAEDIAIDVFSELLAHGGRYNFKVSLKTYLFMLGRSRALDFIRHNKKIIFTDLSEADKCADEEQLEEQILTSERKRAVHSALERLPRDMREVLHLIYFEDMTYSEAAKIMKKSRKQIDNLLYRAKKELRTYINEDGDIIK